MNSWNIPLCTVNLFSSGEIGKSGDNLEIRLTLSKSVYNYQDFRRISKYGDTSSQPVKLVRLCITLFDSWAFTTRSGTSRVVFYWARK